MSPGNLLEICLVGFVNALLYIPLGDFLPSQSLDVVLKLMNRTCTVACVSTHTVACVSKCCTTVNNLTAVFQLNLSLPVAPWFSSAKWCRSFYRPDALGLASTVVRSLQQLRKCSSLSQQTKVHLYRSLDMSDLMTAQRHGA